MANKDRVQGKARELGGTAQERVGAATGDEELEAHGAGKRARGKAQGAVGKVKEAAEDLKDTVTGH
jgi:uncharacterized protein YjbJ (UPF0337 family)